MFTKVLWLSTNPIMLFGLTKFTAVSGSICWGIRLPFFPDWHHPPGLTRWFPGLKKSALICAKEENWLFICHPIFFRLFNPGIPTGFPDMKSITIRENTTMGVSGLLFVGFMWQPWLLQKDINSQRRSLWHLH